MADSVQFQSGQLATPASGTVVSTDEASSGHIQRIKLTYSADGSDTHVHADAAGLLVNAGAHLDDVVNAVATTDQALTTKSAVFGYTTANGGSFEPVKVTPSGALTVEANDGGASLTVDGTVSIGGTATVDGTVAATQSGAWTVTANAGTGPFPVSDNGGSLTVDGTVNVALSGSSSATLANVNDAATSATLLSANSSRMGLSIFNDSTSVLYLKFGTTASTTSFTVRIDSYGYYEMFGHGVYTGRIDGIWNIDSTGAARITEW